MFTFRTGQHAQANTSPRGDRSASTYRMTSKSGEDLVAAWPRCDFCATSRQSFQPSKYGSQLARNLDRYCAKQQKSPSLHCYPSDSCIFTKIFRALFAEGKHIIARTNQCLDVAEKVHVGRGKAFGCGYAALCSLWLEFSVFFLPQRTQKPLLTGRHHRRRLVPRLGCNGFPSRARGDLL